MAARCPFLAQLEQMPRLTEARYADGLSALYSHTDPMEVARKVFDQAEDMPNSGGLSTLFTTWGQFLDHDLSLTPEDEHGEEMKVDGFSRDIARSEGMEGSGELGPRQFGNAITWQIDGSQIYGSNSVREADIRSFEGGQLRMIDDPTSTKGLLPLATEETVMAGDTSGDDAVFLAGDIRASENPNLLSLHTLFAREHNYWAERLAEEHPDWSDQDLFEVARSIVEYELQAITYNEWLPHLIGPTLPENFDYDPQLDGQISLEFSTAAFRFSHTMVSGHMPRFNEDGSVFGDGHLELLDNFFNPEPVKTGGIDSLLRGQAALHAQEVDTKVIDDLNFFLATPDGASGFSLPALNMVRGADHGMGSYLDVRAELLGDIDLSEVDPNDFSIITDDPEVQREIASAYESVHEVDLWVGGLAEDKVEGTQSGPLFTYILSDQFYRTAAADQTFGELDPRIGSEILAEVKASGMKDVILRTTHIDTLQDDPFLTAPRSLTFEALVLGTPDDDAIALSAIESKKTVETGDGDDVVTLSGGTKIGGKLDLGPGEDKLEISSGEVRFDVDMGRATENETVTLSGTARVGDDLHTGAGNDTVRMTDIARVADDVLTRGGNDSVALSGKAEIGGTLKTGAGSDRITLSEKAQAVGIEAGAGDDVVFLLDDASLRVLDGGAGEDVLGLGDRAYRIEATENGAGRITFLEADGTSTGEILDFTGIEFVGGTVEMSNGQDLYVGTAQSDVVDGLDGDDTVFGLGGHDTLSGGRGDDRINGGQDGDRLRGDTGDDTILGGAGFDRLAGNSGNDVLDGGNGNDKLFGASGDDAVSGSAGDDRALGGMGADTAFGNSGDDTLLVGHGDDLAFGGTGNDLIDGGAGNDALRGGGGQDTLIGGGGNDTLTGGDGEDRFEVSAMQDGQITITDYGAEDALIVRPLSETDLITILTEGENTILSSSENASWRIVLEGVEDLSEDDVTLI